MTERLSAADARIRGRLILEQVKGCPYREPIVRPGCRRCRGKAHCHAGYGVGGMVTVAECANCVTGGIGVEGAEARRRRGPSAPVEP